IGFVVEFAKALKALPRDERAALLTDAPWRLEEWIDQTVPEASSRQMRHVLLHLLYPDEFERIASSLHKRLVVKTFGGLVEERIDDDDQLLFAIRQRLRALLPD